ncbi:MAG: sulfur carrier protein ThiS [Lentisphaeria bacterium]
MNILVNGEVRDIPAGQSIDRLLADCQVDPESVVVEVDGRIVTSENFSREQIPANATIEIVHFVGGG